VNPSVGSLERVGQVAIVCAGAPGSSASLRAVDACTDTLFEDPVDFGSDGSAGHVYAIATLESRGELAVVDLSSKENNVLDFDASLPGETPLPVGASPVDLVATPKGTAVFVASADPARPQLQAIGAEILRPCEVDAARCDDPPATVSSWPSCRLSSTPGRLALIADPPDGEGKVRASCEGEYLPIEEGPELGDLAREGVGWQLLYVTLPQEGRVAVIDAQRLLDAEAGSQTPCEELASVTLSTFVPPIDVEPLVDTPACGLPPPPEVLEVGGPATPVDIAVAGGVASRAFVSDLTLPVIHALDVSDPCAPREEASPLRATSAADPSRRVVTTRLAVSPLTPSERRYLYAIDVEDRSVIPFDVTSPASSKLPLQRADASVNPFQPVDRVRFAAAPTDLSIVVRDEPRSTGATESSAAFGTLCDPDPDANVCSTGEGSCDLGTLYRTSSDFESGAGPFTLRGVFGMVSLATGQVAIIDIEDFDAPCRGPSNPTEAAGCSETGATDLVTTDEPSCSVVSAHQPRAATYLLSNDDVGRSLPGIQTFPVLASEDGTILTSGPTMRAALGASETATLAVGGDVLDLDPASGFALDNSGPRNALRLNFKDVRVHQADQEWALTYRGVLPGFSAQVGRLDVDARRFEDVSAGFCRAGVQPKAALVDALEVSGLSAEDVEAEATRFADRLRITEPLFDPEDAYWSTSACTYQDCRGRFGDPTAPTAAREVTIVEAFEGALEVELDEGVRDVVACCFPTLVDYEIRPNAEWTLVGGASGFVHSVVADSSTGECRPSCDPRLALQRARVRTAPPGSVPRPGDPFAFQNALFSLSVVEAEPGEGVVGPEEDQAFRFITQASFTALRVNLLDSSRPALQIQSLGYVPPLDEVFVSDGGLEGIVTFPGDLLGDLRQFF
jgi:hypothetical protein